MWVYTDKGKRMPIDSKPSTSGNVEVIERNAGGEPIRVRVLKKAEQSSSLFGGADERYLPHFASCPNAEHFRRCGVCHKSPCICRRNTA